MREGTSERGRNGATHASDDETGNRLRTDAQIERMIERFETALRGRPNYAIGMIGLATVVAGRNYKLRALELCRQARDGAPGDAEVLARARRLFASLVPAYHVPMMNDARRN